MQTLHDPFVGTTPSQRLAAYERHRRMERFVSAAHPKPSRPIAIVSLPPIPTVVIAATANYPAPKFIPGQAETVLRAVSVHFPGISLSDIKSAKRTAKFVRPRQIAMYLARECTPLSTLRIGRHMGGRDHSTVIHSIRKISALVRFDAILAAQIEKIKATIEEMTA